MNTINRLQLRHHTPIFETREAAIEYIYSQIRFADEGLAFEDKSYGFSLLGEPTVLLYKNVTETDPTGENDPHLIFAIGSATNEGTQYNDNRFCIIDIDKTEKEIEDLWEELEKAIKSLSIFTRDTNTLKLYSEKTEDGTIISGDVVVATSQIFDDARKPNIILSTDDGLFTYVNMEYDKDNDLLTFTVNGETKQWLINNNYLVGGWYSKKDESLHLKSKDDSEIVISLENLIDEWGVEGEASNTPIVLTREEVGYGDDSLHNHVEPWQDVLKADVRLADRRYNILKKASDGRYLYVDGLANNITFFKDGEEMTVQEALANATKGVSNDSTNIIYEKADGFYATAMLKYINKENKLVFTTSNVTGGTTTEEIKLNSVEAFKKIVYDPVTEALIIMYVDGNGDIQECDVPIGQMMQDWEWDIVNDGHNVKLHKQRVVGGNDKVSADAAIYDDPDNILVDKNHELFVKGTADNIRYGRDGNVSDELDKLNANDADINARLNETSGKVDTLRVEFDAEAERATSEEQRIEDKLNNEITRSKEKDAEHDSKISTIEQTIGDGFSIDGHETITYKFNELSAKTNTISAKTETIDANLGLLSAKTEAEIVRAKSEEQRIEKKFDDALGEGFDIRNTVRDEFDREKSERVGEDARLQAEIDALSADTKGKLVDVINLDHSIDVDKTDPVKPVISVNLSDEQIENMPNVIKLNNDGLYAGVDLDYYFESGTSKNVLVFKTTNGTKTFDLKTNSVVDKIYYDPTREAIIIEYTVDGKRMPDVVVPVHDLINEWRVSEDTNGAIKLSKYRESGATQDVLYAESIISDHEDNILINDNGTLYVSGAQVEQNKADIAALGDRMNEAESGIDSLESSLAVEISRAEGEEQRIEEKLDREISRSTTEDNNLWESLRAEIARSTDKDNEHDGQISDEIKRANYAEHALHDKIGEETTARISGDTALNTKIDNEITNRTNEDLRLEGLIHTEEDRAKTAESAITHALEVEKLDRQNGDNTLNQKIDKEISRVTSEGARIERELKTKIDNEISRATAKDNEHDEQISDEIKRANDAENALHDEIVKETTARISGDTELNTKINSEITRATKAESSLTDAINNEASRAATKEAELVARVRLDYNAASNQLILEKENGSGTTSYDTVTLNAGSIIQSIEYDSHTKELVIKYEKTSEPSVQYETRVNVEDLFNPWLPNNPSDKSAIELTLTRGTGPLGEDQLSSKVLITDDHDGDGKPDEGSDNVIEIRNNGLYVNGSAISGAVETAECAKNELRAVEKAVIGHIIAEECGSGYTYEANQFGTYINSATSFASADFILDQNLKRVEDKVDSVSGDTECIDNKANKLYQLLYGTTAPTMPNCGSGVTYQPYVGACVISGASSFMEADQMLNDQICAIMGMWVSGETCTTKSEWVDDGTNKKMIVDVKLSRGNGEGDKFVEDKEIIIDNLSGDYIDPTSTEFTDTNALRIVCLTDGGGVVPSIDTPQNGIYLSNVWDCGLYYDEHNAADIEARHKADAAGYNTNYLSEDQPSSYNYNNNVR